MPIATHLFEAAAWHQAIKPVCACGHSNTFDPHGLWWHFERRHWDTRLEAVRLRFWCLMCKSSTSQRRHPQKIELVRPSDADVQLPLPPMHVWKRAKRAFR
ncbi:hypothetical protein EOE18_12735 [Novosphingobium umbonatum]|uniref:Uncharacterized protein n=1 Tax=Novosphingobium umbonatum TaxID=1908524 RepID=A0A437N2A2_9SPHN|nr:hypothetical protein EOE18_12735 [Novosphingobium umbonatum]